jgi:hypothetical protein
MPGKKAEKVVWIVVVVILLLLLSQNARVQTSWASPHPAWNGPVA